MMVSLYILGWFLTGFLAAIIYRLILFKKPIIVQEYLIITALGPVLFIVSSLTTLTNYLDELRIFTKIGKCIDTFLEKEF